MELLEFLLKKRRSIILGTLIAGIIGVAYSLLTPAKYEATSCIMPSIEMMGIGSGTGLGGGGAALSMLQFIGGLAVTPADIYADLATNRVVIENLIKKFALDTVYKAKYPEDLIEIVRKHIKTSATTSGFVYISYRDKDPKRAATICNAIITELDRLNRDIIITKGKKMRTFLGQRLKETEDSMKLYQDSLAIYQERYGILDLETSIKSLVKNWENIEKDYITAKLQYQYALAEQGPGSKITSNLKKRLNILTEEKNRLWNIAFDSIAHLPAIKDIPEIGKRYARIKLMLEKYIQTYKLLATEYEKAKIMEKQNTPTLQIIYKANVPERRYWPKRKLIVLLFVTVFFFTYVTFLVLIKLMEKTPQGQKALEKIKYSLLHPLGKE